MEEQFWRDIWKQESQGFHEGAPNAFLTKHIGRLREYPRILVPLCGRSHDLQFLADAGHEVVGVELVEHAARLFFEERGLQATEDRSNGFLTLRCDTISIIVANVLELTPERVGSFDAIYDRAATVALTESARRKYAEVMCTLLRPSGIIFLVTFVDPERDTGPPFSVDQHAIEGMYPTAQLEIIDMREPEDSDGSNPGNMTQKVFWISQNVNHAR